MALTPFIASSAYAGEMKSDSLRRRSSKPLEQILYGGVWSKRQTRDGYMGGYPVRELRVSSEFAICHVVRHDNANSIQNPCTLTNPAIEPYCILLAWRLRCRAVERDKSQTHHC